MVGIRRRFGGLIEWGDYLPLFHNGKKLSVAIYLLIKQHNSTGLKYLCKHEAQSFDDCVKYRGSGVYWTKHIKKHGNNVSTECIFITESKELFKKVATDYSLKFDVVNSQGWANLTIEEGQGGNTIINKVAHGKIMRIVHQRPEVKEKVLKHLKNHLKLIQPKAAAAAKKKLSGFPKTENHKEKMRGLRPHVIQSGSNNNNSKKIKTPFGIFGSIIEASYKIEGYTYRMIWNRLQKMVNGIT